MNEIEPEINESTVDLDHPSTDVIFALQHNADVLADTLILDTTDNTQPPYDPELVTWVDDPASDTKVALVTDVNLRSFAIPRGYASSFPSRLYNALKRAAPGGDFNGGPTGDFLYSSQAGVEGLLASKLPQLVNLLAHEKLSVTSVRIKSIKLLGEFVTALYPDEHTE